MDSIIINNRIFRKKNKRIYEGKKCIYENEFCFDMYSNQDNIVILEPDRRIYIVRYLNLEGVEVKSITFEREYDICAARYVKQHYAFYKDMIIATDSFALCEVKTGEVHYIDTKGENIDGIKMDKNHITIICGKTLIVLDYDFNITQKIEVPRCAFSPKEILNDFHI